MTTSTIKPTENKNKTDDKGDTGKETVKSVDISEMSEEDKQLVLELELCISRLSDPDPEIIFNSLTILRDRIRTATSSLTSVPKPLKMLRPHWPNLVKIFKSETIDNMHSSWFLFAEILSVLGMTIDDEKQNYCLEYRLIAESFSGVRPSMVKSMVDIDLDIPDEIKQNLTKSKAREKAAQGLGSWGHEYVKRLAYDLIVEWNKLEDDTKLDSSDKDAKKTKLNLLVSEIVPFFIAFNAETDACDLLMEVDQIDSITDQIDKDNVGRVCLYLTSCEPYVSEGENTTLLRTVLNIRKKLQQWPEAMYIALRLNNMEEIESIFLSCKSFSVQKQLAYILGRQHVYLPIKDMESIESSQLSEDDQDELTELMSNANLSANFLTLATELDIMEPKTPDDVYKTHLENNRPGYGPSGSQVESAKMNLASAYVNAFVNCGFGKDKLMMTGEDGNKFIYKNKDHGKMAATASLGAIQLWDVGNGLSCLDKHLYSKDDEIKAGAFLGCGVVTVGINDECDPSFALLSDYLQTKSNTLRRGAIYGLGIAYAGSNREDVIQSLLQFINEENDESTDAMSDSISSKNIQKESSEILSLTALSIGSIASSSCNSDVVEAILLIIKEKAAQGSLVSDTWYRMLALGLALPFLCQQDAAEPTIIALKECIPDGHSEVDFRDFTIVLMESLAYCATGNVLKIQKFLHICSESADKSKKEEKKEETAVSVPKSADSKKSKNAPAFLQGLEPTKDKDFSSPKSKKEDKKSEKVSVYSKHQAAVLGIALIAMNEDVGTDMTMRVLGSLLRYGENVIKKTVPLAFALLSISNPRLSVLDALSKLSHDSDVEVAQNAIFAMGLVASGTNNARLAQQCRGLAQYYGKDGNTLFLVRLTQGLIHMGKGTMTLQPYQGDRTLLNRVSMSGIITVLTSFMDTKNLILGEKHAHYLLYSLFLAVQPKMLLTFDENLKPLQVTVRVGQAVDVVGQAGKPKTITGFQTRTTPVLLGYGERAELATDEYISYTPVLEGHVILRKNPDYEEGMDT